MGGGKSAIRAAAVRARSKAGWWASEPYAGTTVGEGIRLWATAEFGEATLRLMPKEVSLMESDMGLALAGVAERREERMRSLVRPFPPADTG